LRVLSYEQDGRLAVPLAENLHYIFMVGGCINIVQHWLKNGLKESPHEIARVVYDMSAGVR